MALTATTTNDRTAVGADGADDDTYNCCSLNTNESEDVNATIDRYYIAWSRGAKKERQNEKLNCGARSAHKVNSTNDGII